MNPVLWIIVFLIFGCAILILFFGFINKPNHPPDDDFKELNHDSLNSEVSDSRDVDPEDKKYFP
jgi:hypothetical protein